MNHILGHAATARNTGVPPQQQQQQHTRPTVPKWKLPSPCSQASALFVPTGRCQRSHAGGVVAVAVLCHPAAAEAAPAPALSFSAASKDQPDHRISQPLVYPHQPDQLGPEQLQQGVPHHARTWRPKWQVDKVTSISGVCRMVQQHGQDFSPGMWVKSFVQVVKLVDGGQQVPSRAWQQLKQGFLLLTASAAAETAAGSAGWYSGDAELQDAQATAAAAPINSFTAWQLCTLLWAAAKLGLQVPEPAWPALLAQACQVSSSMSPRDTSLTLWALARLKPPLAVGWVVEALLQDSRQPLTDYPPRSLSLLLHSMARLKLRPPAALQQQLVAALEAHLTNSNSSSNSRSFSGRDLCLLLWSLPGLRLAPPASVVTTALRASRHHLAYLDCSYLTALLVGVGRLRFVPAGPWLLDLYDQLYWTVDQLSLGQLAGCLWSLGRLRLVAVPPELLDRLLVFVGVRLQEVQQQQQQQQRQRQTHREAGGGSTSVAADASKQAFTMGKQMGLLLSGLLGLSSQLRPEQQQVCSSWLLVLLESPVTPQSAQQVGGALHAAARLQVRLSDPDDCAKVWQAVWALRDRLRLPKLAAAVWGAVQVACPPHHQHQQQQLSQWLAWTQPGLASAGVGVLLMLLHACVLAGCQPPATWWALAQQRLQQLVPQMSSKNCVFLSQLLLGLLAQMQPGVVHQEQLPHEHAGCGEQPSVAFSATRTDQQQQQEQQASPSVAPAVAHGLVAHQPHCVVSAEGVRVLVSLLAVRVEQLEVQQHIAGRSLQNFERNRSLLLQLVG